MGRYHRNKSQQPDIAQPPVVALWILELVLSHRLRDFLIGDLCEEYAQVRISRGDRQARLWFWNQTAKQYCYWILRDSTVVLAGTIVSVFYSFLILIILLMSDFVLHIGRTDIVIGVISSFSLILLIQIRNKDLIIDLSNFLIKKETDINRSKLLRISELLRSIRTTTIYFCILGVALLYSVGPGSTGWVLSRSQFFFGLFWLTFLHSAAFISLLILLEEKAQRILNGASDTCIRTNASAF